MIKIHNEEIALWTFRQPSVEKTVRDPAYRMGEGLEELSKILKCLHNLGLFFVKKIEVSRSHLDQPSLVTVVNDADPDQAIKKLTILLSSCETTGLVRLVGTSNVITTNETFEIVEGLLDLNFSLRTLELNISTYASIWVPIDLEGQPQVELAELNASRLEKGLECIANNLNYEEMYPSKEEAVWDQRLGQKGFKLFINEEIIDEKDFPKDKYDVVQKYFWKNRDD